MKYLFCLLLYIIPINTLANVHFKEETSNTPVIGLYLLLAVVTLSVFAFLWKKKRSISQIKVVEQLHVSTKTKVTVFSLQNKTFILAENSHALALLPLPEKNNSDNNEVF